MADRTQLNRSLNNSGDATVLNRSLSVGRPGNVTVVNSHVASVGTIAKGTVLCKKYCVTEKLTTAAGEAELYLCTYRDTQYVAKIYRRTTAIKSEVADRVKKLDSPYVAKIHEMGEYAGVQVEILPYFRQGTLQGKTFDYDQLRNQIIPCLNEGLKALHDAQIIHKDLKPSNIMLTDDLKRVVIIDFGISSITEDSNTVLITKTGMTPEYSALETFRGVFSSHADYYSLGITLYELFCGKTPYYKMPAEEIERYISVGKIPFPVNMPKELKELIKALTYNDISNRRDKNNPNRRWGYEEVCKWLAGIRQPIPGEGAAHPSIKPYQIAGKNYTTQTELVRALVRNWNEGKKHLFRGTLSRYYKIYDTESFKICQAAENEAAHTSGKDDLIFWKTMYVLDPTAKEFFWQGHLYEGLPALGRDLLEYLRKGRMDMHHFMDSVCKDNIMSQYLAMKMPENVKGIKAIESLEASHRTYANNPHDKQVNLYLIAYMLSGQRIFYIDGQEFHTLDELTSYMKCLLGENNENLKQFMSFCHSLMDQYNNLTPAFESWLMALGKGKELAAWKETIQGPNR